jgi:anti-sigma regulatory factor (Ser/Thr protein kinase)
MDWCVDDSIPGARDRLVGEVLDHLHRRAVEPAAADLMAPIVERSVDELRETAGEVPVWVRLTWEALEPHLQLRPLAAEPSSLPGRTLAPGLTAAYEAAARFAALDGPGFGVDVTLGVARPPERDLDPGPAGLDVPADQSGYLAAVAALHAGALGAAQDPQVVSARIGAATAARAEQAYRERTGAGGPLDAAQIAEAFVAHQRALGADFFVVEADDRRAVLRNRTCPFRVASRNATSLCRSTSAALGSLAARSAGEAAVTLDERLALGDHQCRVVLDLDAAEGLEGAHRYTNPPAGAQDDAFADDERARGYRVALSLRLPRDRMSVPVVRHLSHQALDEVGVVGDVIDAIDLALSEACANVLDHAGPGDAYDVTVTIGPSRCEIRVIDIGRGFDYESLGVAMSSADAEQGRGLALMHALMDDVNLTSEPERGTIVHLVKRLQFDESSPARRLLRDETGGETG